MSGPLTQEQIDAFNAEMQKAPLEQRLVVAQVGSCTCMTKTPEIKYHDAMCHYRLFQEAHDVISGSLAQR